MNLIFLLEAGEIAASMPLRYGESRRKERGSILLGRMITMSPSLHGGGEKERKRGTSVSLSEHYIPTLLPFSWTDTEQTGAMQGERGKKRKKRKQFSLDACTTGISPAAPYTLYCSLQHRRSK